MRSRGGDLLTDGPVANGTVVGVRSGVSLTEGRGGPVGELQKRGAEARDELVLR